MDADDIDLITSSYMARCRNIHNIRSMLLWEPQLDGDHCDVCFLTDATTAECADCHSQLCGGCLRMRWDRYCCRARLRCIVELSDTDYSNYRESFMPFTSAVVSPAFTPAEVSAIPQAGCGSCAKVGNARKQAFECSFCLLPVCDECVFNNTWRSSHRCCDAVHTAVTELNADVFPFPDMAKLVSDYL
jgi:hypothetical protein